MSAYHWTTEWAKFEGLQTLATLEVASTNSSAKENLKTLGHRSLVVTNHQTAGRGRGAHTWSDNAGQALLSSWIFKLDKSPQPILSALIGLSLYEAVVRTWPAVPWTLKAPNDLHVVHKETHGDKASKVAGILIEVVSFGNGSAAVVIGLGMNLTGSPSGTKPFLATSIADELKRLGHGLTESDWGLFLKTWITLAEKRVIQGAAKELESSDRAQLVKALGRHPLYAEGGRSTLESVKADGSLCFVGGRETSWSEV